MGGIKRYNGEDSQVRMREVRASLVKKGNGREWKRELAVGKRAVVWMG